MEAWGNNMENQVEFFKQFHDKDEKVIHYIYTLYYKPLCFYAERILLKSTDEVEDIVVEGFLKLVERRKQFSSPKHIKAFLFTTVRNASIDVLRRRKKILSIVPEASDSIENAFWTQAEELTMARILQTIYAHVEELPAQCKAIFKESFISGKPAIAIAEEMGLSRQTVLNQKARAIKLLRLILYNEGIMIWQPYIFPIIFFLFFF